MALIIYVIYTTGGGLGQSSARGQFGNLPMSDQCFCKLEGKENLPKKKKQNKKLADYNL